jgi:hypothetical protein
VIGNKNGERETYRDIGRYRKSVAVLEFKSVLRQRKKEKIEEKENVEKQRDK